MNKIKEKDKDNCLIDKFGMSGYERELLMRGINKDDKKNIGIVFEKLKIKKSSDGRYYILKYKNENYNLFVLKKNKSSVYFHMVINASFNNIAILKEKLITGGYYDTDYEANFSIENAGNNFIHPYCLRVERDSEEYRRIYRDTVMEINKKAAAMSQVYKIIKALIFSVKNLNLKIECQNHTGFRMRLSYVEISLDLIEENQAEYFDFIQKGFRVISNKIIISNNDSFQMIKMSYKKNIELIYYTKAKKLNRFEIRMSGKNKANLVYNDSKDVMEKIELHIENKFNLLLKIQAQAEIYHKAKSETIKNRIKELFEIISREKPRFDRVEKEKLKKDIIGNLGIMRFNIKKNADKYYRLRGFLLKKRLVEKVGENYVLIPRYRESCN